VFFSSHILSDVETISDRVAIVIAGKIHDVGRPRDLVAHALLSTEVHLRIDGDGEAVRSAAALISARAERVHHGEGELIAHLAPGSDVDDFLAFTRHQGGKVIAVTPHTETLEDLFMRRVESAGQRPELGA
jgi:ABC-2 type transport system ATP-binding protein